MKIEASTLQQESRHFFQQQSVKEERLLAWVGDGRPAPEGRGAERGEGLRISDEARRLAGQGMGVLPGGIKEAEGCRTCEDAPPEDPRLQALRLAVEALIGRKIILRTVRLAGEGAVEVPQGTNGVAAEGATARQGWGLEYDYLESYAEEESLTYAASGIIRTTDGKEISFSLDLAMSRSFYQSTEIHIRQGDARLVDPLVVNFDGRAAELTGGTFSFDLDGDGHKEELHRLASGSAFLALDRNGDGVINNGNELFGPQTGHGFTELAAYDDDKNGWIDENDAVFKDLVAWIQHLDGPDQLLSLMDLGIGALSLASLAGDFSLTDHHNELLGKIRETSVFVKENGQVGTVQELDLVV